MIVAVPRHQAKELRWYEKSLPLAKGEDRLRAQAFIWSLHTEDVFALHLLSDTPSTAPPAGALTIDGP